MRDGMQNCESPTSVTVGKVRFGNKVGAVCMCSGCNLKGWLYKGGEGWKARVWVDDRVGREVEQQSKPGSDRESIAFWIKGRLFVCWFCQSVNLSRNTLRFNGSFVVSKNWTWWCVFNCFSECVRKEILVQEERKSVFRSTPGIYKVNIIIILAVNFFGSARLSYRLFSNRDNQLSRFISLDFQCYCFWTRTGVLG